MNNSYFKSPFSTFVDSRMDVDHDSSSSSSSSQPSPLRADSPMDEDKAPSKEEEESRSSMDEDESFSEEEKEPSSDQEEDEHPSSDAVQHGPSPISSYHPSTPTVPLSHETIDPSCPVLQPSHEIPAFTLPLPLQPPSTSSSSSLPPPPPPQTGNVFDSKSPPKPKEILDWFLRNLSSNHPDIVRRILVYVADGEGEKERRRKIEAVPGLIKEGWEVYDWMVKEYKKYFALYPDRFKGTMSYAPPNLDRDRDLPPPLSPRVDIWNYACKKENLSTSNEWHDENMKSVPTIQIMSKSTAWIASKEKKSWTFDICPQAFDSSAAAGAAKQQPRYDRDKAFYPPNTIPGLVNVATTVIAFILRTNVPTIITTHGVYWPRFFQNLTSSIGVPYLPNSLSIPTPSTYAHQLSLGSDLLLPSALAGSDLNIILQHLPHAGDLSFGGRNGSFERRITGAVQLDAGTTLVGALSGVSVKTEDEWRYISKRGTKYTGVLLDRRVLRKRWLAEGLSEEVVKQKDEDYWEGLGSFEGKDVLNATFLSDCEKSKKQWLKKQGKKLESGEETEARRLAKEAKEAKKKKETEERRLAKEAKEAKEKEERRLAKEAKEKDLWIAGLEASTTTTSRSVPLPSGHGLVQPLSALPQAQQPPATTTTSLLHLPIPPSLNFYHHLPPRPLPRLPLHQASLVPDSNPFLLTPNLTQAHGDAFLLPSSNSTAPPSSHQPLPNSSSPPPRPPPPPASVLPPLLPAVACENCEDTISDGVGKRGSGGKTLCDPCALHYSRNNGNDRPPPPSKKEIESIEKPYFTASGSPSEFAPPNLPSLPTSFESPWLPQRPPPLEQEQLLLDVLLATEGSYHKDWGCQVASAMQVTERKVQYWCVEKIKRVKELGRERKERSGGTSHAQLPRQPDQASLPRSSLFNDPSLSLLFPKSPLPLDPLPPPDPLLFFSSDPQHYSEVPSSSTYLPSSSFSSGDGVTNGTVDPRLMGMSTSWFGSGFDGGDAGARGEGEVGGTVDRSGSSASRSSYQPSPSRSGAATPVSQVSSPHLRPQNHPSDFASLREDNLRQSPFYPPPPQQPSSSSSSIHHANEELFQLQHNPNLSSLVPNSDPSESHEQFRSYEEFVAASQAWLNPLLAGGNDASNIALSSTMDFSLGLEAPWANVSWSSDFRTQPSQQQQHHYHPQQQPHQSNEDFISAFQPNFDFDLPSPQRGQRGFSPMQFDLATETFGGDVGIGQDRGGRYDGTSNFAANSTDFLPSHPSPYSNPPSLDDAVLYPFEPPAAFEPFAPLTQQQQPSDVNSSDASSSRKIHKCGWSECGTDFEESMDLTVHINKDHVGSGKNWYTCGWEGCERGSKGFKKKQEVMKHIQTHTGHKPFVCDHPGCDKTFTQRASLTIHKQTHDGIKPFACPHCGQAFVKASNLAKHIRTHTGDKPFPCLKCSKRFARSDALSRHQSVHTRREAVAANGGVAP